MYVLMIIHENDPCLAPNVLIVMCVIIALIDEVAVNMAF